MNKEQRDAFDRAVDKKQNDSSRAFHTFEIHERQLSTLLLELIHRKLEVVNMQRDCAIEKIVSVRLGECITTRLSKKILLTIIEADSKSERFLNLTSTNYHKRP